MKKFHQISGFVAVPVMVFSALVGLGLLGGMIFKNNNGLSSLNKGSLSAQVSQTFNVYRTLNICSSPDELLTLSSTCQTARCGTHFGAAEYYACSGTCAGGVNSPQTCALQSITTTSIVYRTLNICSSPDELTLSSTCQTARCGTHFGAAEYYACSGTCAGGVNSPQTCALQQEVSAPTPTASIKVLSPNGGESYKAYDSIPVKLSLSTQWPNAHSLILYLVNQNKTIKKEMFKLTTTGTSLNFSTGTYDTGTYPIPPDISSASNYSMLAEISSSDGKLIASDQSDAPFTISAPAPTASVKVISPNEGNEKWEAGETYDISFQKFGDPETPVAVYLSGFDEFGGAYIAYTITNNAQKNYFSWTVSSSIKPGKYSIRVVAYPEDKAKSYEDSSDAPFTITAPAAAPSLKISVSTEPSARTIIAGVNQYEFTRYILDASNSSEDLRMISLPLQYAVSNGGSRTDLTNCKLYDGGTVLTTGLNVVNPYDGLSDTNNSYKFTFDGSGLTLTKGYTKQLSLKCDLKSSAIGAYAWGFNSNSVVSVTGLVTGQNANITKNGSGGQVMTASSGGALSVSLDSVSPYRIVSPGQTAELARLRFSATGENIQVKQVALQLSSPELNTPIDLVGQKVTLWDGATKVGEAVFANGDNAISSAITNFVVPAGGSKVLTVKGVIANISAFGPLTKSGDLLKVDYDGGGVGFEQKGNYGVGQSSGQNVFVTGSDTNSTGVRIMKAYPEFELIPLTVAEKVLPSVAQDNVTLYKFKVTAKNGDLSIAKFTFQINSKNYSFNLVSKVGLYAFTDSSYSSPDGDFTGGLLNFGQCYNKAREPFVEIYPDKTGCNQSRTSLKIPSGESRWFKLRASVSNLAVTQQAISVQLEGDGNYLFNDMQSAGSVNSGEVNNDFIWSPRSTSTNENDAQYIYNLDWINGYGVSGLPSDSLPAQTLTASGYSDSSGQQTISALQAQIEALLQQIKSLQDQLLQQRFSQPLPSAVPATLKSPASTPSTAAPATTKSSVSTQSVAPTAVKPAETVVITPVKSRETFSHTWNVDLNYGLSNNADVRALQNALILENVYKGEITGGFFSATRQGVVEFQKKYNLPEYGFVGKYTRAKLNELYSK